MELIKGLKIEGKQGPFYVRKITMDELAAWQAAKGGEKEKTLGLVQLTLCHSNGKSVYTEKQRSKMERDLGAMRTLWLAKRAHDINEFDLWEDMAGQIGEAEKN